MRSTLNASSRQGTPGVRGCVRCSTHPHARGHQGWQIFRNHQRVRSILNASSRQGTPGVRGCVRCSTHPDTRGQGFARVFDAQRVLTPGFRWCVRCSTQDLALPVHRDRRCLLRGETTHEGVPEKVTLGRSAPALAAEGWRGLGRIGARGFAAERSANFLG